MFLLDSNIYPLALLKGKNGDFVHHQLTTFLKQVNPQNTVISRFVLSEVSVGGLSNPDLQLIVKNFSQYELIEYRQKETLQFIKIKYFLAQEKRFNRTIDWFIAAQCITSGYTLVTANIKDFANIEGLKTKFYNQKEKRWN